MYIITKLIHFFSFLSFSFSSLDLKIHKCSGLLTLMHALMSLSMTSLHGIQMQYGLLPGVYLESGYTRSSTLHGVDKSSGISSTDPMIFLSSLGKGSVIPTVQNLLMRQGFQSSMILYLSAVRNSLAILECFFVSLDIYQFYSLEVRVDVNLCMRVTIKFSSSCLSYLTSFGNCSRHYRNAIACSSEHLSTYFLKTVHLTSVGTAIRLRHNTLPALSFNSEALSYI